MLLVERPKVRPACNQITEHETMRILFWVLLVLIAYCYIGYPVLLSVLAAARPKRVKKGEYFPTISIVMTVCNEERIIMRRIRNLLSLDYPSPQMEILIGSDGSTDRTNTIIQNVKDERLHFIPYRQRKGKMARINQLTSVARGEIVVFADARQVFESAALRELVSNFNDPSVGCVSGELIFSTKEGATAEGINLYWEYEKWLRQMESRLHSMIGATGAIYAIRRELFSPAPENVILDDVYIPLRIVLKGYRAVLENRALAFDSAASNPKEEFTRKARTLAGNYQLFFLLPGVFNPFASPLAIQVFSHKVLRLMIPFFLMLVFGISMFLNADLMFRLFLWVQIAFYAMAMMGALTRNSERSVLKLVSKLCYVPYVFCLLNFSALAGFWRFITATQEVMWRKAHT